MMGTPLVITLGQLVSLAILVLVIALVAWFWRRRQRPMHPVNPSTTLQADHPDPVAWLQEEMTALRTQVSKMQQELDTIKATRPVAMAQPNYSQAIEMARQGQPAAEVANRCGISRAEAELIVAMHGSKDKT